MELILSGDSANKDVRKKYSESATLDRIGANLAEVLRHADALSAAALVAPLAAVARAGGADGAARLGKKMLGVFFEEKRTDSKVGGRRGCGNSSRNASSGTKFSKPGDGNLADPCT